MAMAGTAAATRSLILYQAFAAGKRQSVVSAKEMWRCPQAHMAATAGNGVVVTGHRAIVRTVFEHLELLF